MHGTVTLTGVRGLRSARNQLGSHSRSSTFNPEL